MKAKATNHKGAENIKQQDNRVNLWLNTTCAAAPGFVLFVHFVDQILLHPFKTGLALVAALVRRGE